MAKLKEFQGSEPQKPPSDAKPHHRAAQPAANTSISDSHYVTWESAPNPKSHFSIGDQGTTASINAYGQLMQLGKYFGAATSGFFCLDQSFEGVYEPWFPHLRAANLESLSQNPLNTKGDEFGLVFPGLDTGEELPRLSLLRYRWPRYQYRTDKWEMDIHWMIHDGHLLQQCVVRNLEPSTFNVEFEFRNPDNSMAIRDLEFLDPYNSFNEKKLDYHDQACSDGHGWRISHQLPSKSSQSEGLEGHAATPSLALDIEKEDLNTKQHSGATTVVVSVFLNGEPVKWKARTSAWTHKLEARGKKETPDPSSTMEIVVAYRMCYSEDPEERLRGVGISTDAVKITEFLSKDAFSSISIADISPSSSENGDGFQYVVNPPLSPREPKYGNENVLGAFDGKSSPNKLIEFVTRRHLEHILSVCAIPVPRLLPEPDGAMTKESNPRQGIVPIALTCGDMSGHVVCTSASFFAFTFLLEIARRLRHIQPANKYVSDLLSRISTVCEGHMVWLELAELENDLFSSEYWPTGKALHISEKSYLFWNPMVSIDTPLQIIKAGEFAKTYRDKRSQELARGVITKIWDSWVENLKFLDKRGYCAWSRSREVGTSKFRLDDQVWIWRAISIAEEMGIFLRSDPASNERDSSGSSRKFSPRHLQQEMLRRFTTENSITKKRMLAVTRSTRRNRFLFHAKDTALFYGEDWGFFPKDTQFKQLWANTIELQKRVDGNQKTDWENALRYGLALVMGTRKHCINNENPREIVKFAFSSLINSSGQNGFFSGNFDSETKEPILFNSKIDREYFFNTSFEIPFIIITNAIQISEAYHGASKINFKKPRAQEQLVPPKNDNLIPGAEMHPSIIMKQNLNTIHSDTKPHFQSQTNEPDTNPSSKEASLENNLLMKHSLLSTHIDLGNIVEVDEEWLYNYPNFFYMEAMVTPEKFQDILKRIADESFLVGSTIEGAIEKYLSKSKAILAPHSAENEMEATPVMHQEWGAFDKTVLRAGVWDVSKKRARVGGRRHLKSSIRYRGYPCLARSNAALWRLIGEPRDALEAKKRLIWLPAADMETALACYMGGPLSERSSVSQFFDRHTQYKKYFFETVIKWSNNWTTEFHLSFHRLLSSEDSNIEGITELREDTLPGRKKKKIVKCATGFRFTGDFFDRYWTCHWIEYPPVEHHRPRYPLPFDPIYWSQGRIWAQRKILELLLFDRVVTNVLKGAKEIYTEIASEFGLRNGVFAISIINSEDYFSRDWLQFQHMLEAIELDLKDSIENIRRWNSRVKDRGEQPRWTRNDEQNYSEHINKLVTSTIGKTRDLQSLLDSIKALKDVIIQSQEHIRGDLSLRGSENIRFFTYVTVIFLPLGFAASVLSMNGTPSNDLVVSMVIYATVSLVLTFLALYNAATIGKILSKVFKIYYKAFTDHTMQRSSLERFRDSSPHPNPETTAPPTNDTSTGAEKRFVGLPNDKEDYSVHFWFWYTYIVIELPARRVILGYNALKDGQLGWKTFYHVPIAVLMVPVCFLSWMVRVAFHNLIDLLKFIGGWVIWLVSSPFPESDEVFQQHFSWLTQPPPYVRPFQKLNDEMKKLREKWDNEKCKVEEEETPDKIERKSTGE